MTYKHLLWYIRVLLAITATLLVITTMTVTNASEPECSESANSQEVTNACN